MPMLDMPLAQLKEYEGINPCPQDFEVYWDKALQEMRATDSNVEWIRAEFQVPFAECFHLYFTGVKGARIHAKVIKPKQKQGEVPEKMPAILMFHGYTGNCGDWNDKLQYTAAGFVVAALDCRGQAGLSEDVGGVKGNTMNGHFIRGLDGDKHDLLMRNNFLDAAQLAGIIMDMPEVDEQQVFTTGGSQGGAISLACAALEPRISRIGVCYPFLSDYKRVWEMDLAKGAYAELEQYFRWFDPLHEREDEIFEKLGYIDVHHLARRIKGKVLMAVTLVDSTCPPSTQFAVFNQIQSEKEIVIYQDYGHEFLPGFGDRLYGFFCK
ncbi:acetylxylan esterase [Anaerosporobacter sp.]|uniref:acetylxylan esterase n=1 Tax=Anaerosporobacter sp. TaxID=1872529 RepID=UPI00286F9D0E|nr:acetylxylan esterase [Anaerosporobacter sp.]